MAINATMRRQMQPEMTSSAVQFEDIETVFIDRCDVRRLVAGWLLLALLALALSTACAVLLVAARTPLPGGIAASNTLFRSALVLHVGLAVVVWFLACAAGFWTLASGAAGPWRWAALALAAVGMAAMVMALLVGSASPVLANYVPVLDSPLFLAGLTVFFTGISLCTLTSIVGVVRRLKTARLEIWRLGAVLSIGVAVVAIGALITALVTGIAADSSRFDVIAWGPGHVLQFMHVVLLMSVWSILGERALGRPIAPRNRMIGLLSLAVAPVLATPVIYFAFPTDSADFRHAFTTLMMWGSWPASALLAVGLLVQLVRAGRSILLAALPLALSILLFLLGCIFGASIRGESTMIPAHYHGTVGAVTLAYMALGYRLLPAFGFLQPQGRLVRWQPLLYGGGLMILASALAWSGWLGVPRKTSHVDVIVQYPAYFAAMGLAGLGGSLGISGAALFVVNIVRSLRTGGWRPMKFDSMSRQVWLWVCASVTGLALMVGLSLYWPNHSVTQVGKIGEMSQDAAAHVKQKRKEEIDQRFARGVTLLNAKQYDAAASELHRVLELAPQMPEAHVNMGFAMIGLQRYAMAKTFFDVAIELRRDQRNAYFGLAIALEGLRDLPGALGAMRSYVHLSKVDDPYLRKANAAIWEWEEELKKVGPNGDSPH